MENIECVREKVRSFSEVQRYVVLVMDEMKIQSSLVFDKYSGDLIGFIDLGDPMVNFAFVEEETLATHALAFFGKRTLYGLEACNFLLLNGRPHIIPTDATVLASGVGIRAFLEVVCVCSCE